MVTDGNLTFNGDHLEVRTQMLSYNVHLKFI